MQSFAKPERAPSSKHPRYRRKRAVRTKLVNVKRIAKRDLEIGRALFPADEHVDAGRPRKRADCIDAPRPCPFITCKHHLYLDVEPSGSYRLNFPDVDPDALEELPATCALDVAARDGATLEVVAEAMNLTRERTRQIETVALAKVQAAIDARGLRDFFDEAPTMQHRRRLPVLPSGRPISP